jgi:hypothetical protein
MWIISKIFRFLFFIDNIQSYLNSFSLYIIVVKQNFICLIFIDSSTKQEKTPLMNLIDVVSHHDIVVARDDDNQSYLSDYFDQNEQNLSSKTIQFFY